MTDDSPSAAASQQAPRWQPIGPIDRRVVGVLVEKAKTVPSAYPMSVNAICTAASQKNNRHPLMDLKEEDAEESLERLRALGAVGLVQGYGRVAKHRHYLYEWMGVDKVEIAVMAELLLRGAQTEGELRARAARMEPIADLAALRAILNGLESKRLVVWLTPEGRGRVVSHTLYTPREMENVRAQFAAGSAAALTPETEPAAGEADAAGRHAPDQDIHHQVAELRSQVAQLRADLDDATAALRRAEQDLSRLRSELGA